MNLPLKHMLLYKHWANKKLYAVLHALPVSVLQASQPIKFGSILATAQHVYDMDRVWQAHLLGEPHNVESRTPTNVLPFNQLALLQVQQDKWFVDYIEAHINIDEIIQFRFIGGTRGQMSVAQILFHVVNHATYHRGHIAQMLYTAGISPPVTDYPVFCRDSHNDIKIC